MNRRARPARVVAAAVSALIVLVVVVFVQPPPPGGQGGGGTPSDLIYDGLVAAMRQGNVKRYLACFDEPLRSQLDAVLQSDGAASFRRSLQQQNSRTTGVGVSKVETSGDDASLRLEWVYQTDSDVQAVRLRRAGGRWRITEMAPVRRSQLPIPYGTEVIPGLRSGEGGEQPEKPQ